ncbi:BRO-N domain-containing protein [Paraburkholderia strydomiana]|uniref:BRO-N domain-containing protein n=1 Tax=Paraburkholderia strydomiana TaxID=1245417 RepID=UPI0038B8952F
MFRAASNTAVATNPADFMAPLISTFAFDGKKVRSVVIDGKLYPVGKDVCDALGYANHNDAMGDHCRGVAICYPIPDRLGRMQETRVLSEGDMMRLITHSTLPAAERFERMVFDDILPCIHRHGCFPAPSAAPALANPFDLMQSMLDQMRASEARISRVEQAQASNNAAVAALRDDIPLLVSNGQSRAVVSEPSHGVQSMSKIAVHWNEKAGVPHWVTEYALRQSKRFRIVATENIGRGIRRHADGTPVTGPSGEPIMCPSYPGYQMGAATRMMTLFFRECERHATDKRKATHPDLPDRPFNLSLGYAKGETR